MKSLREAIDIIAVKAPAGSTGTLDIQAQCEAKTRNYSWIAKEAAHMRSVREMLEGMWEGMAAKRITPKDAFFSLLMNGILIGIEMAKDDKPTENPTQ